MDFSLLRATGIKQFFRFQGAFGMCGAYPKRLSSSFQIGSTIFVSNSCAPGFT